MVTTDNILRRVRFQPYRTGAGPVFYLVTWDTGRYHSTGKFLVGYRLSMREGGRSVVLFEGEDFGTPRAIDSDETCAGIMGFLTLRPGDTDPEYFAAYTTTQLDYCEQHAESLDSEVRNVLGEY